MSAAGGFCPSQMKNNIYGTRVQGLSLFLQVALVSSAAADTAPVLQTVLCDRCLHPHSGVTAVLHECRICPYKITPPTMFLFSVASTVWAAYEVLCKKHREKKE